MITFALFPTLYKYVEISLQFRTAICSWFEFSIRHKSKCSHNGLYFTFSFLKLIFFSLNIYDERSWNYKENRYFTMSEHIVGRCHEKCCWPIPISKENAEIISTEISNMEASYSSLLKPKNLLLNEFHEELTKTTNELKEYLRDNK